MATEFSLLERNILKAKGLSEEQLAALGSMGVMSRADFEAIGTIVTLLELFPDLDPEVAARVLEWALPPAAREVATGPAASLANPTIVVDASDAVFCANCNHKQPKDYTPGDLCVNCGRQAEPIEQCFWCGSSGPGKRCRSCGAVFVRTADLPLALLLRRDGLPKDDIPRRLAEATSEEKEELWGRVRRARI
ncbi:zinc ribbon domain-containing protein [Hymenobacter sp. J193]|uniref:zinc ribbon domain-containing protein n=1 Tax=Hymenobacter sp. J193 TaxID=2898429 RepID=UPI002150FFEE|nr:zinc ribbon domain-containing protein [Hymenobacter sp. J193]MCR5890928.1 zinc ribbon domain-containing protein [Hymenobacter sp. J193]